MRNIYCLSGLAADERILVKLQVVGYNIVYLPWQIHNDKDDMKSYALKMAGLIEEENPVVLGLSFGGMLATEIANHIPLKKVFLISSSKTKAELPKILVMNKWLAGLNVLPPMAYKLPNPLTNSVLGANTKEEQDLIKAMMNSTSGAFIGWAIKAMANWENTTYSDKIVHIHGKADKLITPENVKADYWIDGGTHIMVYNRADEINTIIHKELSSGDNL